ncbi:MAG: hypothetical protein JWM51_463, partial [Microbacteriaceae bacterium]|nr:hypothetical protein [Microbacteriaceae bacterium]
LPGLRIGTGPGSALPLTAVRSTRPKAAPVQVSTTPIYDPTDGER